jgi:hypothetical protein
MCPSVVVYYTADYQVSRLIHRLKFKMNVLWELDLIASLVDMAGRHLQIMTVEFAVDLDHFVPTILFL